MNNATDLTISIHRSDLEDLMIDKPTADNIVDCLLLFGKQSQTASPNPRPQMF